MEAMKVTDDDSSLSTYQCPDCLSQYREKYGEEHRAIAPLTLFEDLPPNWSCSLCETPFSKFIKIS